MRKIPKRWLWIDAPMGNPWVLPIYTALGENRRTDEINRLGTSLSDKLTFLPMIFYYLKNLETNIYDEVKKYTAENVSRDDREDFAIKINQDKKWVFIIILDSYLFELNATCDLIKDFSKAIYEVTGQKIPKKKDGLILANIFKQNNKQIEWFKLLDNARNHFMHKSSPYFAVDVSPEEYDILIMKENIHNFNDPEIFIRLSELKDIYKDFHDSLSTIKNHLINLLKK